MKLQYLAAALFALMSTATIAAIPNVGEPARGNQFQLTNGQKLSVEDMKGMVVVLNYWVEDCRACDEQIKRLDFFNQNRPNVGLVTIVASANNTPMSVFRSSTRGTRKIFMAKKVNGWIGPMEAAPTTYVIDRKGVVRYAGTGVMTISQLNDVLLPVIREPQPPM